MTILETLQADWDAAKADLVALIDKIKSEGAALKAEAEAAIAAVKADAQALVTQPSDPAPIAAADPVPAAIPGGNPDGTAATVDPSQAAA